MNPYASYLGSQNPLDVIAATASQLEKLIHALGPEAERSPAPGKWSAREIVCHLADTELFFAFRLRQTLAEDHHVIQPFDQEKWAKQYRAYNASEALATFAAVRNWNLALLRDVDPKEMTKPVRHPERGEMTFRTLAETMAGHDLNHLGQVERIATRKASA